MKKAKKPERQMAEIHHSLATKTIRFTLNPHSSRDRRILAWLARIARYHRAEAVRSALDEYLLRLEGTTGNEAGLQAKQPNGEPSSAGDSLACADSEVEQKLKRLFS